jgi:hypothetical protein
LVTIQNILPPISLSDPGSLIPPLLFIGMGMAIIILDLRNWRKERRQGLQHVWYQRLMTLIGVLLIIIGLMIVTFTDVVTFSSPRWLYSALSIVFLLVVVILSIYAFLIIIRSTIRSSSSPHALFVGHSDAEQTSIAANPLLLITRMILIGGTFLLLVAMLLGIVQVFSLMTRHHLFLWGWALLIGVPLLAFWLMRMSRRLRTLQRIERLRFSLTPERSVNTASLSGSPTFFAPFSITLRLKRIHLGVFAALVIGLMIPGTLNLVVQFIQPGSLLGQPEIFSLIFWIGLGLIAFILCFIPLFLVRTTIETRENGLRTEAGTFMHWHEARLFARYELPGLVPGDRTTVIYELSSSSTVITWRWIQNPRSPLTFWRPFLPPDEYHQQMQALCDLVIEKTGLQVYTID